MSAPLPADITGSAAAAEEFRWPAPAHFEFVREQDRFDWANCLLLFRDGTEASGRLHSFVPDAALLMFQQDGAGKTVSVAFSVLLKLQLRRPVELRRETLPPALIESEALLQPACQPFRIGLANGEIFQGVTLGYVSALCGQFLYLPQANGSVVRCFVPARAAETCSIDQRPGSSIDASRRRHDGAGANAGIDGPLVVERRVTSRLAPQAAELPSRNEIGVHELVARLAAESGNQDIAEQQAARSDSALVGLVNRIILDAVEQKASDIHVEANLGPKTTRVRLRKDGTLVNYLDLPAQFRNAVVSRIKIMSQLDITERRKPQDGKIDFSRFGPAQVELRIATVPTTGGLEDVVMRVLAAARPVPMDDLGLEQGVLHSIKRLISRPYGLFIVCGPTGSGKTTTLHSLLAYLNTFERKIWTAEDPIEITQPGLRQVQVNSKIGWTFAAAMRSFMRADPDVIMVGEMRDAETAKIGIEASLTGHLVLSTLHTNSAAESIVRLLDLGMDPFNFADALLGVLAERLARRLCPECKTAYAPTAVELEEIVTQYCNETAIDARTQMNDWRASHGGADGKIILHRAHGCEHCGHSGYQGRIGLYELLLADAATKRLLKAKARVAEVKGAAIAAGMRTLRQDGIEKVLRGVTDMQQVSAQCN